MPFALEDGSAEWYMVKSAVWQAAGMVSREGFLCIGCLEIRLGRPLHSGDFTPSPVNSLGWPTHSARLRDRLSCPPLDPGTPEAASPIT
jgi:hypothetical protein